MKFGIKKYLYLRSHLKGISNRDSNQGNNIAAIFIALQRGKIQEDSKSILEQQRFIVLDESIDKDYFSSSAKYCFCGYEIFLY